MWMAWRPVVADSRVARPQGVPERPCAPAGKLRARARDEPSTRLARHVRPSPRGPPRNRTEPSPAASGSSLLVARARDGRGARPTPATVAPRASNSAANTSPRARRSGAGAGPPMPVASAASDETAQPSRSRERAERAVATPMRRPVNGPGPTPTAIAPRSCQPSPDARASDDRGHQLGRVGRAVRPAAGLVLEGLAVRAHHADAGRRRGVDAEEVQSIVSVRRSRPRAEPHARGHAVQLGLGHARPFHEAIRSGVR